MGIWADGRGLRHLEVQHPPPKFKKKKSYVWWFRPSVRPSTQQREACLVNSNSACSVQPTLSQVKTLLHTAHLQSQCRVRVGAPTAFPVDKSSQISKLQTEWETLCQNKAEGTGEDLWTPEMCAHTRANSHTHIYATLHTSVSFKLCVCIYDCSVHGDKSTPDPELEL